MNKISGIYKIQSKIKPERIYIGSSLNMQSRWFHHLHDLRKNKHHSKKLQRHYNKYRESDLLFSIIISCQKKDILKNEQFFLDSYNTYFNECKIAGNCMGITQSEETKEKRRQSMMGKNLGKKHTLEARIKISNFHKGKTFITKEGRKALSLKFKGRVHSEETKEKMRIAAKNRWAKIKLKTI